VTACDTPAAGRLAAPEPLTPLRDGVVRLLTPSPGGQEAAQFSIEPENHVPPKRHSHGADVDDAKRVTVPCDLAVRLPAESCHSLYKGESNREGS